MSGFSSIKPVTGSIALLPKHHASLSKATSLSPKFFQGATVLCLLVRKNSEI